MILCNKQSTNSIMLASVTYMFLSYSGHVITNFSTLNYKQEELPFNGTDTDIFP